MLRRTFIKSAIGIVPAISIANTFAKTVGEEWYSSENGICIIGDRSGFWFFSNRTWPEIYIKSEQAMQIYFEGSDSENFKDAKRLTEIHTVKANIMYAYKIQPEWPGYIRIKSTHRYYYAFMTNGKTETFINLRPVDFQGVKGE